MSSTITKALIFALAAAGAIQAAPQGMSSAVTSADAIVRTETATTSWPTTMATKTKAPAATNAPAPVDNSGLIKDLLTAPTAIKRFQKLLTAAGEKLLSKDELKKLVVFDFTKGTESKGGSVKAANIETFPILTELGISTTVAFLNPCGINTPHVHPRATEFLTVVEGDVDFGYILENGLVKQGSSEITGSLSKFQGTVFPMGSIHYQFNNKCQPATFVATLNSEDPGTSQVAQNFFGLNGGVLNATLGFPKTLDGKDIESFRKNIPANLAQAIDTCLKGCGMDKRK